jgi:hypothetical protein
MAMNKFFFVALFSDLLTPILIWQAGLPAEFRWLSLGAILAMMVAGCGSLLRERHFPNAVWLVVVLSIVGTLVALVNGQTIAASAWGWWLMFKYPMVGLYAYFSSRWPEHFPERLRIWCVRLLCFEVIVQVWQYMTGETPGDNLAGTLGIDGTAHLVMLVLFVLALVFGYWIVRGKARQLALVIGLGVVSSVLGEMKLFPFALALMGMLALVVCPKRNRDVRRKLSLVIVLVTGVLVFPSVYSKVFVPTGQGPQYRDWLDRQYLEDYFTHVQYIGDVGSGYDVGRNYVLFYTWHRISSSAVTLGLGEGLGARGESKTLGSEGQALLRGDLGLYTGSSLVVIMNELGIIGLLTVVGFMVWVIGTLWKARMADVGPEMSGLLYGLLLYTLMWPLWLWYTSAWVLPVPMLIYWTSLGYVLGQLRRQSSIREAAPPSVGSMSQ